MKPLHERLWSANLHLARACLDHPFVQGLATGDLETEAFRRYVGQDAFFLRAFLGAHALAAARCARFRLDLARRIHSLMGGVLEELDLHAGYAADLGIDLDEIEPAAATRAYTDFLLHTAWTRDPGEIFAAMTPCMRLYAYLGQQLAERAGPEHPYREWIRTYASDEFDALAETVESLLDELAAPTEAVGDAYRYAMECERNFFSAPLEH